MGQQGHGDSSWTDLRGAQIVGSAIASGTRAHAEVVTAVGQGACARLIELCGPARRQAEALATDPERAGDAASLTGVISALEGELRKPQPDVSRVRGFFRSLTGVSADVVTLTPAVGALVAAVRAHFGW